MFHYKHHSKLKTPPFFFTTHFGFVSRHQSTIMYQSL